MLAGSRGDALALVGFTYSLPRPGVIGSVSEVIEKPAQRGLEGNTKAVKMGGNRRCGSVAIDLSAALRAGLQAALLPSGRNEITAADAVRAAVVRCERIGKGTLGGHRLVPRPLRLGDPPLGADA
jgi:hypothetical protein